MAGGIKQFMITKVRENIYLADKNVSSKELESNKISLVVMVGNAPISTDIDQFWYKLDELRNKPHIKDLVCHIVKYSYQNGDAVCVVSDTGLKRGAFVVSRVVCELESRSIYEVMLEIKNLLPNFDIGKAYL